MIITVRLKPSKHFLIINKIICDAVILCFQYPHILTLPHKIHIKMCPVLDQRFHIFRHTHVFRQDYSCIKVFFIIIFGK